MPIKKLILVFFVVLFSSTTIWSQTKKFPSPTSADAIMNPLAGNDASVIAGKKIYTQLCVTCHGDKGKGDGIAAPGLPKRPADHTSAFVQDQTDGALFWIITAGNKPMPSYKTTLTATQRWQVINYIRTLSKVGKRPLHVAKASEPKTIVKIPNVVVAKPAALKAKPTIIPPASKPAVDKNKTIVAITEQKKSEPVDSVAMVPIELKAQAVMDSAKTVTTLQPPIASLETDTIPAIAAAGSSAQGLNKFAVFGNAEMIYFADKHNNNFGEVNFKPIFLWKISEKLFVEAEPEFETGGGSLNIGLEYANMCYIVNPYLILHAGRFLPKFGSYRGRMGEAFINRFSSAPVGFGDGGIGTMNEVGVGAQGGFGTGSAKINYELYAANGPQILTNPDEAGQFDYESYAANSNAKAIGGRIGILPFSNSSLEIAYSFQNKNKTGEPGTPYENVSLIMQAVDLNYWGHLKVIKTDVRVMGEWKHQKASDAFYYRADSSTYTFKNSPTAYYIAATLRPSHVANEFIRNIELGGRYSKFIRSADAAWGGDTDQFALSLDYWLKWNTVVKLTWQHEKNLDNALYAQVVFGF